MKKPLKRPSVTRRTECWIRDAGALRRLVITVHRSGLLTIRPERTRRAETLLVDEAWSLAVKQRVAREKRERAEAKKAWKLRAVA